MKLLIDIDENVFTRLFDNGADTNSEDRKVIDKAVRNGIPYEEQPTGEWIYLQENPAESTSSHTFRCSACTCAFAINGYSQIVNFKICPSCGANMIVEDYICSYNDEEEE